MSTDREPDKQTDPAQEPEIRVTVDDEDYTLDVGYDTPRVRVQVQAMFLGDGAEAARQRVIAKIRTALAHRASTELAKTPTCVPCGRPTAGDGWCTGCGLHHCACDPLPGPPSEPVQARYCGVHPGHVIDPISSKCTWRGGSAPSEPGNASTLQEQTITQEMVEEAVDAYNDCAAYNTPEVNMRAALEAALWAGARVQVPPVSRDDLRRLDAVISDSWAAASKTTAFDREAWEEQAEAMQRIRAALLLRSVLTDEAAIARVRELLDAQPGASWKATVNDMDNLSRALLARAARGQDGEPK